MSSTKARHRKDARPVTSVTPVARRSLAAAASSGLALTMIASGAHAAGSTEAEASAGSLKEAGVGTLAANARAAVSTNAAVHVSPDASTEAADVAADVTAEAPVVEQPAPQANTNTDESTSNSTTATNASATENAADSGRSTSNPAPAPASNAGGAVAIAMQYVGRPYVSGAAGPDAFDCSGLVQYVYAQMGISLPRTAQAQGSAGRLVSAAEAQPGDIVYFGHHVGIYAGDGKMIDAGTESTGVVYRDIYETPIGYVRVGFGRRAGAVERSAPRDGRFLAFLASRACASRTRWSLPAFVGPWPCSSGHRPLSGPVLFGLRPLAGNRALPWGPPSSPGSRPSRDPPRASGARAEAGHSFVDASHTRRWRSVALTTRHCEAE